MKKKKLLFALFLFPSLGTITALAMEATDGDPSSANATAISNHNDSDQANQSCPICLENLQPESTVQLQCHAEHLFCRNCIFQLLKNDWRCPICRANISGNWIKEIFSKEQFIQIKRSIDMHLKKIIQDRLHQDESIARQINRNELRQHNRELIDLFRTAIRDGNIRLMDQIITMTPHIRDMRDNRGMTFLHYAAGVSHRNAVISFLIDRGIDIDCQDRAGATALHYASAANEPEIIRALIRRGANKNARSRIEATPLHFAVSKNSIESIKELVNAGADLNSSGAILTPLSMAVKHNCPEIIKILLASGADPNKPDNYGMRPVHIAAQYDRTTALQELIQAGANLESSENKYAFTALHIAAANGKLDVLKALLDTKVKVDPKNNAGLTPLHIAIKDNAIKVIQTLLRAGADPELLDDGGYRPIHTTAQNGQTTALKELIRAGANLEGTDANCSLTALHIASMSGKHDIITALLDAGAKIDPLAKGNQTPLFFAAGEGYTEIAKKLIEAGADPNQPSEGFTPLSMAIIGDYRDIAKILLAHGADPDKPNDDGVRPVHMAARYGRTSILQELIQAGANLESSDYRHGTPTVIHIAAANDHVHTLKALLDAGVKTDPQDTDGITPLHIAIKNDALEIVKTLLDARANLEITDSKGNRPVHMAARYGRTSILQELIQAGANLESKSSNRYAYTALHIAADLGKVDILNILLNAGVNMDPKNTTDLTPLHLAAARNRTETVKKLIEAGAALEAENRHGLTPLHFAAKYRSVGALNTLIAHGANLEARERNSLTPLCLARAKGQSEIVTILENEKALRRGKD